MVGFGNDLRSAWIAVTDPLLAYRLVGSSRLGRSRKQALNARIHRLRTRAAGSYFSAMTCYAEYRLTVLAFRSSKEQFAYPPH